MRGFEAGVTGERSPTAYEVLRERYVTGFYTLAEFERYVTYLLEREAA